jgi:hypothetical protein
VIRLWSRFQAFRLSPEPLVHTEQVRFLPLISHIFNIPHELIHLQKLTMHSGHTDCLPCDIRFGQPESMRARSAIPRWARGHLRTRAAGMSHAAYGCSYL